MTHCGRGSSQRASEGLQSEAEGQREEVLTRPLLPYAHRLRREPDCQRTPQKACLRQEGRVALAFNLETQMFWSPGCEDAEGGSGPVGGDVLRWAGWSWQRGQAVAWVQSRRRHFLSAAGFLPPLVTPPSFQRTPKGMPQPAPNPSQIILEPSAWHPKSSPHQTLSSRGPEHMGGGTGTQSTCPHDPMLRDTGHTWLTESCVPPRNWEHSTCPGA